MLPRIPILLLLLLLVSGCARWEKDKPAATLKFPKGRLAPDSVAIEIGIAQLDDSQIDSFENFWALLDQQKLDLPMRKRLDQNGLRVAIMASQPPAALNRLIEPRPVELENLDIVEQQLAAKNRMQPKSRMIVHQRITNGDGEIYPIQVSELHPHFNWLVRNQNLQSPGQGDSVRGLFDIMTLPQGDGTVRLRITPQIHHGSMRPTIGVAERDFVFDTSQSIVRISDLTFDVTLRPGESLVIAPTADVEDLGKLFFGRANNEASLNNSTVENNLSEAANASLRSSLNVPPGASLAADSGSTDTPSRPKTPEDWPDLIDPTGTIEADDGQLPNLAELELLDKVAAALAVEREAGTTPATINGVSHLTHRVLLVRIVQTQLDDLFGNSVSQERLTTTSRR